MNQRTIQGVFAVAVICLATGLSVSARAGDIVIKIEPSSIITAPPQAPPVRVDVTDLRSSLNLERTTFQMSMGRIELKPPPTDLVGDIVATEAAITLSQNPGTAPPSVIYCGLREFTIETPNTLAYWDIHTRIVLVLRIGTMDRDVQASARTRTWIYPSKTLVEQVTRDALRDLAASLAPALTELMAVTPSP
jgi:hypothetical protein